VPSRYRPLRSAATARPATGPPSPSRRKPASTRDANPVDPQACLVPRGRMADVVPAVGLNRRGIRHGPVAQAVADDPFNRCTAPLRRLKPR
jgi:hypothetical protein